MSSFVVTGVAIKPVHAAAPWFYTAVNLPVPVFVKS